MFILHLVASFDGLVNHWLRDYSFFPMEWFWHSCQKSIGHRCLYLFLDSRFYFIFLYVYPGHMKFDSYSFTVRFEIGTCESSNFVYLFEYYLAIWGPLHSMWIWGSAFHLCKTGHWDINSDYIKSVDHVRKFYHLNNIKFSKSWTWDVFPFFNLLFFSTSKKFSLFLVFPIQVFLLLG